MQVTGNAKHHFLLPGLERERNAAGRRGDVKTISGLRCAVNIVRPDGIIVAHLKRLANAHADHARGEQARAGQSSPLRGTGVAGKLPRSRTNTFARLPRSSTETISWMTRLPAFICEHIGSTPMRMIGLPGGTGEMNAAFYCSGGLRACGAAQRNVRNQKIKRRFVAEYPKSEWVPPPPFFVSVHSKPTYRRIFMEVFILKMLMGEIVQFGGREFCSRSE